MFEAPYFCVLYCHDALMIPITIVLERTISSTIHLPPYPFPIFLPINHKKHSRETSKPKETSKRSAFHPSFDGRNAK